MSWGRRAGRVAVGVLVAGTLGVAGPSPAGAVTVTTGAEWDAAWSDPTVAEIVLAADVEVGCTTDASRSRAKESVPLVVHGEGHSVTDVCPTTITSGAWFANGVVTLRDVTMVGPAAGFSGIIFANVVHLDGVALRVRNRGIGIFYGGRPDTLSTVVDTTVEKDEGMDPGLFAKGPTTIDGLRVRGAGDGVQISTFADATIRDIDIDVSGSALVLESPTDVTRSTLRGGRTAAYVREGATATIADSTLSLRPDPPQNAAALVLTSVSAALDQVTVVVPTGAMVAEVPDGRRATFHASVLAGGDCAVRGELVSEGDNVATSGSCDAGGTGDRVLADVGLGPYDGDRGYALPVADGPLVDAVATCGSDADQRGEPRPSGAACDIGAIELAQAVAPTASTSTTPTTTPGGTAPPATPIVTAARLTG